MTIGSGNGGSATVVTMSMVWERTTQVMSGRFGMLATIAALLGIVPALLPAAAAPAPAAGAGVGMSAAAGAPGGLAVIVSLCSIWSALALTAAASSPSVDRVGTALRLGGRRLPVAIGLWLVIGVLAALVLIVPVAILGARGADLSAWLSGDLAHAVSPGAALGTLAFLLLVLALGLWLSARLFLLNAVLVNEKRGIGSLARAFELSRGYTWRLVGVLLLFGIVYLVLFLAVRSVAGTLFELLLGSGAPAAALILTQLASATLSAGFAVVISTFAAQLYRSVSGMEAAEAFS